MDDIQRCVKYKRDILIECNDIDKFAVAVTTLLQYADNVTESPTEPRYRNVNGSNKNYLERVGQYESGRALMGLIGFSANIQEGRLIMPVDVTPCHGVVGALRGVCETPAAYASDAAPAPTQPQTAEEVVQDEPVRTPELVSPMPPETEAGAEAEAETEAQVETEAEAETETETEAEAATEEPIWACLRCTFHNDIVVTKCDMCGVPRPVEPTYATTATSPIFEPPQEESRITVSSGRADAAVGSPLLTTDMGCSPIPQHSTAEVGCSANLRHLKTPLESEAYLEEGLERVRRRLAELCRRSGSGGSGATASPLQELSTNTNRIAIPKCRGQSGTPLRRELTGALECGVCLCLMVYPITTPCGHSFCRHCLVEAIAKTGKKCPTCRGDCDIDPSKAPENKLLANTAKLANSNEYSVRKKEADTQLDRLKHMSLNSLPVLIGDDCPCPGSTCKLQLAEARDVALLKYIARNGGKFVLLPSTDGGRVRKGAIGLHCTLRRAEDLPNGHASASVNVGHRVIVSKHCQASEGHTNAEVVTHVDSNECTWEALAATHHLKKIIRDFFRTQPSGVQRQTERFTGPEPPIPALPRGRTESIHPGSTKYTFWAASVLSHLRIIQKRLKPTLVTQRDCLNRATTLCHVVGSALRHQTNPREPREREREMVRAA